MSTTGDRSDERTDDADPDDPNLTIRSSEVSRALLESILESFLSKIDVPLLRDMYQDDMNAYRRTESGIRHLRSTSPTNDVHVADASLSNSNLRSAVAETDSLPVEGTLLVERMLSCSARTENDLSFMNECTI